ncbi:MAG: hypothetical protein ABIG64_06210 [Candidatus Omnitrophota bacterium]
MNNYGSWEKMLCAILGGIFIFSAVILNNSLLRQGNSVREKSENLKAKRIIKTATELDDESKIQADYGFNPKISFDKEKFRDIFVKHVIRDESEVVVSSDNPVIEVVEISYKPLEIEYKGRLIFDDGRIVAQVNMQERSYLVSLGSTIFQYQIDYLDDKYINLKDKTQKNTKIQYRHAAYSNELVAQIKEHTDQRVFTVSKDSNFLGYKVLDIDEEYVLVSKKGQHLRLEKGMVHK